MPYNSLSSAFGTKLPQVLLNFPFSLDIPCMPSKYLPVYRYSLRTCDSASHSPPIPTTVNSAAQAAANTVAALE